MRDLQSSFSDSVILLKRRFSRRVYCSSHMLCTIWFLCWDSSSAIFDLKSSEVFVWSRVYGLRAFSSHSPPSLLTSSCVLFRLVSKSLIVLLAPTGSVLNWSLSLSTSLWIFAKPRSVITCLGHRWKFEAAMSSLSTDELEPGFVGVESIQI